MILVGLAIVDLEAEDAFGEDAEERQETTSATLMRGVVLVRGGRRLQVYHE